MKLALIPVLLIPVAATLAALQYIRRLELNL